ncbi:hypothetical protein BDK92_1286 [Micromonospora pisi]|uniref:Uncharacterized protein n=1 Tax=Micromonospora pisi TaxID=589240 RepID=A0A495JF50_9ACTN|nr:hypothetical protein [Micromonospora pisi]RKR87014.1 hypothetical protein BDK92_1286 [Micromonospora pisi]
MADAAALSARPVPRTPERVRSVRIAVAVVLAVGVVIGAVLLCWPRRTVVEVINQPPEVRYADGDNSHVAVLVHVRAPIAALQLSAGGTSSLDHYEVVLGSDPSGGYGHLVRVDATGMDPGRLTVVWTVEGAWLNYQHGHRLFVPAKSFVGGR